MAARPLRGVHVFWMVFSFFAVIIGLDSLFVALALKTHPGEEVQNSYVLGLDYNKEVSRREAQRELGWTAQAGLREEGAQMLVMRLGSAAGEPVTGLDVSVELHTLGKADDAAAIKLTERTPGEYVVPINVRGPARVEASFIARRPKSETPLFEAAKTLVIS